MPIPIYEIGHVVDCDVAPNLTTLKRKSVLVTGGSSCLCKTQKRLWLSFGQVPTVLEKLMSVPLPVLGKLGESAS
jgi:hypothetical protein